MTREPRPEPREPGRGHGGPSIGRYAGVGLQFGLSIIACLYVGQWVDRRFGTEPWGVLVGVFVGATAAFYAMYHQLMADVKRDEERQRK